MNDLCVCVVISLLSIIGKPVSDDSSEVRSPRFAVVLWEDGDAKIVKQGLITRANFSRLFLERYDIRGERLSPPKSSFVIGFLAAQYQADLVIVPIVTWKGKGRTVVFLCQKTDDGSAPAFAVMANSKQDLLGEMEKVLRSERR
jgi:hypothetical protein